MAQQLQQQQQQQQQQAYYAQQYGGYQQQAGSSQREQPGTPQQYQQYAPSPAQQQQYPPPPQEQRYPPPPSQQQQYPQSPQPQQYPSPPQQAQSQVDSDREAAEKLAAQFQDEYNREIAEAERKLERLKKEQEGKLKEAERQLGGLRIQSESSRPTNSINTPLSAPPPPQQQQYQQPQPSRAATPTSYGSQQQYQAPSQQQPQYQTQQQWSPQVAPTPNPIHPPEMHPCGIVPISVCHDGLMDMELDWFIHPSASEFLICSRCYVDHIYNTQFQSSFRMIHLGTGQQRKCLFGTKRMKDTLWPEAVSSSSLSNAIEFMQKRQGIPHCTGSEIRPGASWYTSPSIPHATFCAACYEDILMTSSFSSNFTLSTGLEAFCDASTFYVRRVFDLYSPSNNWSAFCQGVQARIQMPKCEKGLPMPTSEHSWYETTRGPRDTVLCGACYCDNFYNTPGQQYWRQVTPRGKETMCLCGNINMYSVSNRAFDSKDLSIFWRALDEFSKHPFCNPYETSGAKWFTLPNRSKEIIICGACYSTMVNVWGGANWFIPKSSSFFKSDKRVCGFNIGHPRLNKNMNAFSECILRGTWKALGDLAALFASVEPCPRSKPNGYPRRYWGWQNAQICEECYVTFAKDMKFEDRYTIREVRSTQGICDLYSSRMRNLYSDACESGDLQSFLNQAAQRKQIFIQMNQTLEALKSAYAQDNMRQIQMLMEKERMIHQDHSNRMAMLNKSHTDALISNMTKFRGDVQG
ncbi:hypothetical protein NCS52_00011000 [Fusarium sp. LHS14.1]|nr:hypothetical protein NCS52_00011000 [Fusarium sp. LHS14.1]